MCGGDCGFTHRGVSTWVSSMKLIVWLNICWCQHPVAHAGVSQWRKSLLLLRLLAIPFPLPPHVCPPTCIFPFTVHLVLMSSQAGTGPQRGMLGKLSQCNFRVRKVKKKKTGFVSQLVFVLLLRIHLAPLPLSLPSFFYFLPLLSLSFCLL